MLQGNTAVGCWKALCSELEYKARHFSENFTLRSKSHYSLNHLMRFPNEEMKDGRGS